jgi:plasmid replication initiation protein
LNKKNEKMSAKDKENREVIQSYLITAAKYDFNADEKRVLSHLIEMMQPLIEGKELRGCVEQDLWGTYHFTLPTSFFFDESTNRQRVKEAIRNLNAKSFEYDDGEEWRIIRLVEMPMIDKRGKIEFYLSPKLVDVFLNFNKGFSKYQLDISLSFNSVYSMRLYELISNQSKPITFRISKLKEMWEIREKSYERNYNFIKKVIKQAQKELDEKSNWSFTYKPIKKGRTFEWIEFTPIHFTGRESEEITRAEAQRMMHLSWELERNVRLYLTQTAG